jgi:hypothetical protein
MDRARRRASPALSAPGGPGDRSIVPRASDATLAGTGRGPPPRSRGTPAPPRARRPDTASPDPRAGGPNPAAIGSDQQYEGEDSAVPFRPLTPRRLSCTVSPFMRQGLRHRPSRRRGLPWPLPSTRSTPPSNAASRPAARPGSGPPGHPRPGPIAGGADETNNVAHGSIKIGPDLIAAGGLAGAGGHAPDHPAPRSSSTLRALARHDTIVGKTPGGR